MRFRGELAGAGLPFVMALRPRRGIWAPSPACTPPSARPARQLAEAESLVRGHGRITAEFFDVGQSRVLPWARRPQAAALLAAIYPSSGRQAPAALLTRCWPRSPASAFKASGCISTSMFSTMP